MKLPGYSFVVDTLSGVFVWVVWRRFDLLDDVLSFHLFHLLLATLSLVMLYMLASEVSGRARIAVLSTLRLALLPQFVAHSQNNLKDRAARLCACDLDFH
jgi:hypothetical protein